MHGTFVHKASAWRKSTECSVHHVPLIFDPIVGTLLPGLQGPVDGCIH